ncbi:hypothetical protein AVEN_131454-1 [Araneus ventricosus]|uniref:Uncharacterized protein n=1 Tax=Araneus ventricosus TaxID=182803 RepID=A0A4Y2RXH4_ARAVE|nr:hypothetical protein AVEN_131454-1 [Araneus ventricosus]
MESYYLSLVSAQPLPLEVYFVIGVEQMTKNNNGSERNAEYWIPCFLSALESKQVSGAESPQYYNRILKFVPRVV